MFCFFCSYIIADEYFPDYSNWPIAKLESFGNSNALLSAFFFGERR